MMNREKQFLLTHPVWDVTFSIQPPFLSHDISTHTSRVGCDDGGVNELEWLQYISTHTSRVGCDGFGSETSDEPLEISTHTSRVGCDVIQNAIEVLTQNFYSHIPCGM